MTELDAVFNKEKQRIKERGRRCRDGRNGYEGYVVEVSKLLGDACGSMSNALPKRYKKAFKTRAKEIQDETLSHYSDALAGLSLSGSFLTYPVLWSSVLQRAREMHHPLSDKEVRTLESLTARKIQFIPYLTFVSYGKLCASVELGGLLGEVEAAEALLSGSVLDAYREVMSLHLFWLMQGLLDLCRIFTEEASSFVFLLLCLHSPLEWEEILNTMERDALEKELPPPFRSYYRKYNGNGRDLILERSPEGFPIIRIMKNSVGLSRFLREVGVPQNTKVREIQMYLRTAGGWMKTDADIRTEKSRQNLILMKKEITENKP